jgi:prevent-host-death family protein
MEFITVRDLRLRPAEVWNKLRQQHEIILTSNGRPVAVIAGVEEGDVEETVVAFRRARAQAAVSRLRRASAEREIDKLSAAEIEAEIAQARRARPTDAAEGSAVAEG